MDKKIVRVNDNHKVVLAKSKSLLNITNKILASKNDDEWIEKLLEWFKNNTIQEKTHCPKIKEELIKAKSISLRWNRLKEVPKEFFNLKQLEILELNNNSIETIPKEIQYLKNLKELNLNINSLKTLPKEIIKLAKLQYLNIKNNKYLELNDEQISWLKKLQKTGCNIIYDKYKFNIGE